MPHAFHAATAETFDAFLANAQNTLVVAYFWGDNCPNCEVFAQDAPALLQELPEGPLRLLKVNAYAHPELATRYGLFGIPAFLFFRNGRLRGRMSRYLGRAEWLTVVTEQLETHVRQLSTP